MLLLYQCDSDNQTLLTNQDGTSFIAGDSFTAFDIEEASDGTIQLLSYVEEDGYITQTITETILQRVKVGRKYRFVEQEVTTEIEVPVDAGQFVITTFDASGQLIQPTTLLNTADQATYDAEKLFGIDLNKDDVRGRNVTQIDELSEIRSYGFTTFDDTTNITDLYLDINSGGLFFAPSFDRDNQTLLKNQDGSSFIKHEIETAFDINVLDGVYIPLAIEQITDSSHEYLGNHILLAFDEYMDRLVGFMFDENGYLLLI